MNEEPKKMVKESRNGIPVDSRGRPIKIGTLAEGEVLIEPKQIELDGKKWFLGPKVTRICGKVICVGPKKSLIESKEGVKEVDNEKITIII